MGTTLEESCIFGTSKTARQQCDFFGEPVKHSLRRINPSGIWILSLSWTKPAALGSDSPGVNEESEQLAEDQLAYCVVLVSDMRNATAAT